VSLCQRAEAPRDHQGCHHTQESDRHRRLDGILGVRAVVHECSSPVPGRDSSRSISFHALPKPLERHELEQEKMVECPSCDGQCILFLVKSGVHDLQVVNLSTGAFPRGEGFYPAMLEPRNRSTAYAMMATSSGRSSGKSAFLVCLRRACCAMNGVWSCFDIRESKGPPPVG
jgi:hypothetical protein